MDEPAGDQDRVNKKGRHIGVLFCFKPVPYGPTGPESCLDSSSLLASRLGAGGTGTVIRFLELSLCLGHVNLWTVSAFCDL